MAVTRNEARISILGVPDLPGTILKIVDPLAQHQITVDMIVQNVSDAGQTDISFTVAGDEVEQATKILSQTIGSLGGSIGTIDQDVAKVSIVGFGMASQTGVAGRMFQSLAKSGVNIQMISTGDIKISALVSGDHALSAVEAVHSAFGLDSTDQKVNNRRTADSNGGAQLLASARDQADVVAVIERLQQVGMESLTIEAVDLDDTQSLITLARVPNQPGIAATIFDLVAQQDIFVDMIVQSYAHDQFADISFTVPRRDFQTASGVAEQLQTVLKCKDVKRQECLCKLSAIGVGLRSHAVVALETFKVLSDAGINIEMVNTSEICLNVAIPESQSAKGLELLRSHFECDSQTQFQNSIN